MPTLSPILVEVFEINVFRWLSRETFNGFSHGMRVHASQRFDHVCELGRSQTSSKRTSRASPRSLLVPRLVSCVVADPQACSPRKKDGKREETYPKVFHCCRCIRARRKELGCAADFLRALQARRWSSESLHRFSSRSHELS